MKKYIRAMRWYYHEPMSEQELSDFKADLLTIPGCDRVDIDTDAMEELGEIYVLPHYGGLKFDESIKDSFERVGKYSNEQREMLKQVLQIAKEYGLTRTQDRIEDYGDCYYIVFNTNKPQTDEYDEF